MSQALRSAVLGIALFCAPMASFGQAVYGSISGNVTDASGGAVPNATVTIKDLGKGVAYNTTTNESGNYSQGHLILGSYSVRVEAPGFTAYVKQPVTVEVDAVAQVNVQLSVGSVGETIAVTAEAAILKTERSDVSDVMTTRTVSELPVLGRDMSKLYFLVPGVQATGTTAASEQPQDIYRPSIGGQYWGGINFQLDGTDNRESVLGEPVITPNLDAVAELKITTTAYDAEFGQASQAVISAQTKSGTNQVHGGGFWYRRDQHGAARDPFAQSQPIVGTGGAFLPPTLWNQFGGSVGGPIQKDKTFIFGDYQGSRQKNGGSLLTRVPTAAERAGDLSDLNTAIFDPCPGGDCSAPLVNRQQFAGGIIPSNRLSPQAQALLKFIPLPNITGVTGATPNYTASDSGIVGSDAFDVRVDRYQTEKLHMFGRYSFLKTDQTNPGAFGYAAGGPAYSTMAFAGAASLRNQSLSYGIDYVITPHWLADFRFGFFRYRVFVNPNGLGTSPAKDAGIPGLNNDSYYTSGMSNFRANGTGGFQLGYSLTTNSCNCPLNEQENEFQWVGNMTRTFGNHSLKFGADVRWQQNLRVPSDTHRSGELIFDPTTTEGPNGGGLGLASFLLGNVNSFGRYVSNSTDAAERQHRLFTYVQDTWKVTPKLTVNYGLRWEIYFPQYVNAKDAGGFQSLATGEVMTAGENGIGLNGNVKTALTHFAPRLGIAYQVTPKTVIRTGYGRSYDLGVFGYSFGHNVTQNLPVLANQSINPANPWYTVFTLANGPGAVLDPTTILASQPKGKNGFPILPNGIAPNVLPLTADNTMRLPVVDAWNFTVEQQITPSTVLSVAYVGNHGYHETPGGTNYNVNQPTIVGFGTLSTNQRRYFYNQFGWTQSIKYFSGDGSVKFNSLQVRGEKRFADGLTFQGNFTWASAFDFANDYFLWNHNIDYGRESGVRRFVINMNNIYELPFGRGRKHLNAASRPVDAVLGGWQLSNIWLWQSGIPFTPSYLDCGKDEDTGPCRATQVGSTSVPNPGVQGWFATATPGTGGNGCLNTATPTAELNTNGCTRGPWTRPAAGTFGYVARNSFFGPHAFNMDASLNKQFRINERFNAQFRAELFNAFNHVNLGQPNATVDSPTAGQITSIGPLTQMRKWQLGLRLNY
jgi:Carboxypeptidase regulatory-like domain/TonB dependent receptor